MLLQYPPPQNREEAERIRELSNRLYPRWPETANAPCCYTFYVTQESHHAKCGRPSRVATTALPTPVQLETPQPGDLVRSSEPEAEVVLRVAESVTRLADFAGNVPEEVGPSLSALTSTEAATRPSTSRIVERPANIVGDYIVGDSWPSPRISPPRPSSQRAVTSGVQRILPPQSRFSAQPAAAPIARDFEVSKITFATASSVSPAKDVEVIAPVRLRGRLPWRPQELPFAEELLKLSVPKANEIHVWFTQIVGTPDIDAVLVCKQVGLFVIELKNWGLTAIEEIDGVEGITVAENVKKSTTKPPWQQAFDTKDAFSNKLRLYPSAKGVWVSPAAALFNISREAFVRKFREKSTSPEVLKIISEGVIFSDDLVDGQKFVERLRYVKSHPVYRKAPEKGYDNLRRYGDDLIDDLEKFINFKLVPAENPTPSDLQRLRRIEQNEEKELQKCDLSANMLCWGFAGTGKTVLGLQAALRRQAATLFTCFNKVLATDIRRLTSFSSAYRELPLEVYHTFELIDTCEARLGIPYRLKNSEETVSDWARRRVDVILEVDTVRSHPLSSIWGLVVVDEAQDLQDYAWTVLERICRASTPMFVIDGRKQQLYRTDRAYFLSETLPSRVPECNRKEKKRIFRTTSETFLLGQLFVDCFPHLEKAKRLWVERYRKQYLRAREEETATQAALFDFELPRGKGSAPKLRNMWNEFSDANEGDISKFVASLLQNALNSFKEIDGIPSDILILVPNEDGASKRGPNWKNIATKACEFLNLDFIDYSITQNRNVAHSPNDVRICTYHSSRGIEGYYSLVLGFECLSDVAKQHEEVAAHLGYIALTRSLFDTDVVYWYPKGAIGTEIPFLQELLSVTGF